MKKESKIYAIANYKCPKCHEGDLFINKKMYNLKTFDKMYEKCTVCNHKFEIESGYFYGAMYVSYGLTVAFSCAVFVLSYLFLPNISPLYYIINISVIIILLVPFTYRTSRSVWVNMNTKYDKNRLNKKGN
jgi:hypothetical protein